LARPRVHIERCPAAVSESEIIARTEAAIAALGGLERHFAGKRKLLIKTNAGTDRIVLTQGRQTELTEPAVVEAVVRAIRAVSDAEIWIGDAATNGDGASIYQRLGYPERLARYPGVRLVDFSQGPFVTVPVPGQPLHFAGYQLHAELADIDACVSVAKMKAHRSLGCTLCIKNLFGLTPPAVYGAPRHYLHDRLIRLPRVLVDLAALFRPCLNIVDGIMTANHGEWGGTPVETGVILAGDNVVSTDAAGMRVMGFDPLNDYPNPPHWYRHNAIKLANEAGLGPADAAGYDLSGVPPEEVRQRFEVKPYGAGVEAREAELRDGAACVERYQSRREQYVAEHPEQLLAFRAQRLLWAAPDIHTHMRWERERCKDYRDAPLFTIHAVPAAREIERLEAYSVA
jgi:uncharacterized protein (DUF362 family)